MFWKKTYDSISLFVHVDEDINNSPKKLRRLKIPFHDSALLLFQIQ